MFYKSLVSAYLAGILTVGLLNRLGYSMETMMSHHPLAYIVHSMFVVGTLGYSIYQWKIENQIKDPSKLVS